MTPLIVNADDFGLTPGVNRSIVELSRARALSSATLIATGAFFDDAVALARANPRLEVGCHIVLVDGTPALAPEQIPTLCPDGRSFRPTLGPFVRDLFSFRIRASEIIAEACAQIRCMQRVGLHVSHIDTHKHTHLFSGILRPLLDAARACGVPAIRNPFEPAWALRATRGSSRLRRFAVFALKSRQRSFQRSVRTAGLATTSGTIGVLATGASDVAATLRSLLAALPENQATTQPAASPNAIESEVWELVCHPGYADEHLARIRTRLRASRAREHDALLQLLPGIPLATWHDLANPDS